MGVPTACGCLNHGVLQFIKKGKRAKAWKELEVLLRSQPSSALCITAAKMYLIAAVEQVGRRWIAQGRGGACSQRMGCLRRGRGRRIPTLGGSHPAAPRVEVERLRLPGP